MSKFQNKEIPKRKEKVRQMSKQRSPKLSLSIVKGDLVIPLIALDPKYLFHFFDIEAFSLSQINA